MGMKSCRIGFVRRVALMGVLIASTFLLSLPAAADAVAKLRLDGQVALGNEGVRFRPVVATKGWHHVGLRRTSRGVEQKDGRLSCAFVAEDDDRAVSDVRLGLAPTGDDVTLSARFKVRRTAYFEALMLTGTLPASRVTGGTYAADGKSPVAFPKAGKQVQFRTKRLVCAAPGARDLVFSCAAPLTVVIRGNAEGGAEVRFAPVYHGEVKSGEVRSLAVRVATGERLGVDCEKLYRIKEGDTWVAWDDVKDIEPGSALDFSSLGFADAPAGKYGWLKNVNGHFEFEGRPGKPVRFAGVNFCGTMNYPTHEETDRVIRRLRALGYNSIRLHHYDEGLVKGSADGLTFNPEQLDRLDYLVAKAIENGLYVTTDLYVSRSVTWRQMGIDRDGTPRDVPGGRWLFKLLIAFHEGAYANWKTFATSFLSHVNPYTGRRYADEPGMPLLSMVNEANYRMGWQALAKEPSFRAKWSAWAAEKRRADPGFAGGVDLSEPAKFEWNKLGRLGDTAPAAFLADNEAANFARQLADMRALGAKALFTSVNHLPYYVPDTTMKRRLYGYFDDHLYIDHPRFPGKAWRLPTAQDNANPLQDPECRFDKHAFMSVEGLPRTVSEFNFCGPNGYRGMNALLSGGFMAGQDVSAYWRFAYSHAATNLYDRVGKPSSFDIAGDPLNCLSERMIHVLYLRGDLQPFARRVTAVLPDGTAATRGEKMPQLFPDWRQALTWKARLSCALPGDVPKGAATYDFQTASDGAKAPVELPDDPSFAVDRAAGTVRLATPRSCGVAIAHGRLAAGALDVDVRAGGFMTTIGVAALDTEPLASSGRLLLFHLTDAQSAEAAYSDATCTLKIENGTQRTVIRAGEAAVRLRLDDPAACVVYGLDAAGRRMEQVPATVEDGCLCFTASVKTERGARMCYEIVRTMPPYATGFDVLKMPDGTRIASAADWDAKARPQILRFFEENVYGALPPKPAKLAFETVESSDDALEGTAKRRQFRVVSTDACGTHALDVLVYVPKTAKGKVPVFVCPNFSGNHSIVDDPAVRLPGFKVYKGVKATEAGRGVRPDRIPVRDIVAGGFAIATFCHCNLYVDYGPNRPAPLDETVWSIFPPERRGPALALTAWAWGNMRTLDLLETLPEIDATRAAVVGQSRLAKVAVITAAFDARFGLCCPNDGGCKTLSLVPNLMFPHWFAPGLRAWTEIGKSGLSSAETAKLRGEKPPLPFDQSSLVGCIAPRVVHFGASSHDIYAPPDLPFATLRDAASVWRLFGKTNVPPDERLLDFEPFFGDLSWHCKFGPHSINRTDWRHYMESARRAFCR